MPSKKPPAQKAPTNKSSAGNGGRAKAAATKSREAASAVSGVTGRAAVAGLIIAALSVPLLAVATVSASATVREFDALPDYLDIGTQPQQNRIIALDGDREVLLATVYSQNRKEIGLDDVTDTLRNVVLAAEDRRFYEHGGIDVQGIIRAVITDVTTGSGQGASTLTQQTIKNVCIAEAFKDYPAQAQDAEQFAAYKAAVKDCNEGTIDRKIREMKYAIGLEKKYSKDEILLAYLNVANYGGTVYGIQSAAERYYNKDAKDLTLVEAASLIAIVQQPGIRRLDLPENYEANTVRRDSILNNMAKYGFISDADRDAALAVVEGSANDTLDIKDPENGCYAANQYGKQFCDYVVKNVRNLESLGEDAAARERAWRIGGYTLYTTLNIPLQKVAQNSVQQYAPNNEKLFKLGASAVTVEVGTGRILTMAQNKTFDDTGNGNSTTSAINFNTDQPYGGSGGFQVGSTYKVFTLINWLEHDHGLEDTINANARTLDLSKFKDSCNGPYGGSYKFRNDSGGGYTTVRNATARSINGGYYSMALLLDLCDTKKIAESLGIHTAIRTDDPKTTFVENELQTNPASVLGTNDIAPLSVAAAYAAIANDGTYCAPIAIDKIVDRTGAELPGQAQDCNQAITPGVAVATQSALQTAAQGYVANPRDGTPLMGKTGTTDDSKQTWVTMASTKAATSVWYGNINGNYPIRSYGGGGTFGGNQRHLIMKAILTEQDKLLGGDDFEKPEQRYLTGKTIPVGDYTGMTEGEAKKAILADGFTVGSVKDIASDLPEGEVARTEPGAGRAVEGTEVTIYLSDGSQAEVPDVVGLDVGSATGELNAAGFSSQVSRYCVAVGTGTPETTDPVTGVVTPAVPAPATGVVVEQSPEAGTVKSMEGKVRLGVAQATC